jgi:hypothetical protein
VAYPMFLAANGDAAWQTPVEVLAWMVAIPALVLAWVAAASYVPVARDALTRGRAGRAPEPEGEHRTGRGTATPGVGSEP